MMMFQKVTMLSCRSVEEKKEKCWTFLCIVNVSFSSLKFLPGRTHNSINTNQHANDLASSYFPMLRFHAAEMLRYLCSNSKIPECVLLKCENVYVIMFQYVCSTPNKCISIRDTVTFKCLHVVDFRVFTHRGKSYDKRSIKVFTLLAL